MKWYRKVLIGICFLILFVIILNIAINLWIKFQLPKIINKESDSAYFIAYKNTNVSLLYSNIKVDEIVIVPKAALKDSINKAGIYAKIKAIEVRDFEIWDLVFNNKIMAKSSIVEQPQVTLYQKNDKDNVRNLVVAPFKKIIAVSTILLNHGDLKIINAKNKKAVLNVNNIKLNLDGILITDAFLRNKIPFKFNNYSLSCDSLYYHPNEFYQINTKKIKTTKTNLYIDHFQMLPSYSRKEFIAKIKHEKDLNTILCQSVKVAKINWGFKDNDFFFHCHVVDLNHTAVNIYRSKEPADDLTKTYLYNKLLRDLNFDLKIDTLKVRNSILEYEEQKSFDKGAAKLSLNALNLTATAIYSGFKKVKLPDLKINIKCSFMNASSLNINWKLNVMDKSDGFNIIGTLTNFNAEKIIPFSKPYLNLTAKGIIDEVHFNFTGNDKINRGEFEVKYDDLKLTVYKKDNPKKKNKLLSFIAKIFVKEDSKNKVKNAHIEVKRLPETSFYNLLWRSIAQGLKKILV